VQCDILTALLDRVCKNAVLRPNLIVSAPSGLSALERRTILQAACACGAARVSVLEDPIASALGAGVSIEAPRGVLVIDIGAGTTDIAVITMGTVAYCRSLPLAGDDFDQAIVRFLRRTRGVEIGLPTAKRLKHTIGCAAPREEEFEAAANGKDAVRQMPLQFSVTSTELCEALRDSVEAIADAVLAVLEEVPPELFADICEGGVTLCGGSAKLYGLDTALAEKLHLPVRVAPDGEHCAAKGAGYALQHMKQLEDHGFSFRLKERNIS
ncbi:MAG: rod shape-determining protein, partial [Clostridia bacterium]|nr:rod shape-determining protein [Clostridia bacterium]